MTTTTDTRRTLLEVLAVSPCECGLRLPCDVCAGVVRRYLDAVVLGLAADDLSLVIADLRTITAHDHNADDVADLVVDAEAVAGRNE